MTTLRQRLLGRAQFCADRGEVKTPELLREAAGALDSYEEVLADHRALVKRLDVALNGDGHAPQASLCDLVAQFERPPQLT